jgi:amino acid transporter
VLVSVIGGFILLYSITASIVDRSEAGLTRLLGVRHRAPARADLPRLPRQPHGRQVLLFIVCVAQFLCGMASVTANSRMSYAFSRDKALPGSRIWAKVNPRTGTPTNSIWLCVALSVILASPALVSRSPTSPSPPSR